MKLTRHIPNTITSMNLLAGAMGVIFTFQGDLAAAFGLMLLAAVCDFCDGLAARWLHAYSPMGKELDSLADMVSFGLLPSVMLVKAMQLGGLDGWRIFLPLFLAVAPPEQLPAGQGQPLGKGFRQQPSVVDEPVPETGLGHGNPGNHGIGREHKVFRQGKQQFFCVPLRQQEEQLILIIPAQHTGIRVCLRGHVLMEIEAFRRAQDLFTIPGIVDDRVGCAFMHRRSAYARDRV